MSIQRAIVSVLLVVSWWAHAAHAAPSREASALSLLHDGAGLEARGHFAAAVATYAQVVVRYPDDEAAGHALVARALLLERVSELVAAADAFLAAHDWVVAHPAITSRELVARGAGSLRLAGRLFAASGEHARAADLLLRYASRYPERDDALIVALEAARQHELAGDTAAALATYDGLVRRAQTPTRALVAAANGARAAYLAGQPGAVVVAFVRRAETSWWHTTHRGGTSELDDLIWTDDPTEFDGLRYYCMALTAEASVLADAFAAKPDQASFDAARTKLERASVCPGDVAAMRNAELRLATLHLDWAKASARVAERATAIDRLQRLVAPRPDGAHLDAAGRAAARWLRALDTTRHPRIDPPVIVPPTAPVGATSFIVVVRRGAVTADFRDPRARVR